MAVLADDWTRLRMIEADFVVPLRDRNLLSGAHLDNLSGVISTNPMTSVRPACTYWRFSGPTSERPVSGGQRPLGTFYRFRYFTSKGARTASAALNS
jgi:hypothetical protein